MSRRDLKRIIEHAENKKKKQLPPIIELKTIHVLKKTLVFSEYQNQMQPRLHVLHPCARFTYHIVCTSIICTLYDANLTRTINI